ncbi:MAG TPA: helix-turn-helix domain-containing protein [Pseudonocardia sp.]|jgi:hypothetical protein
MSSESILRLRERLLRQQVEIKDDAIGRFLEELPTYRALPLESFEGHVAAGLETTLSMLSDPSPEVRARCTGVMEKVGEAQARLGVPLDQYLMAWRIGGAVLVDRTVRASEGLAVPAPELLAFVQDVLVAADTWVVTSTRAHRRVERERDREAQELQAAFVRAALLGERTGGQLREAAEAYGLDPTRYYWTVRAQPAEGSSWQSLENRLGLSTASATRRGMSAGVQGDLAGFLEDRPGDAEPGRAGIGPPVPLDHLAESFALASRTLHTAVAFGLRGTWDLDRLGLRAAVVADPAVGKALHRRYLEPLGGTGSANEIINTLRVYLACGQHVETAAGLLHIHQNTLRYRLNRFEELTGTHLREPMTPFELWWAIESAMIRREHPRSTVTAPGDVPMGNL